MTRLLLALSALLALAYGWLTHAHISVGAADAWALPALKASGIVLLAAIALIARSPLLACALLFGATGDVMLALGRETFLYGAGAFLIGHVLYIIFFLRHGEGLGALMRPARLIATLTLIAAAITMTALIVPMDDPLFAPLSLYTAVLTAMAISTFTLPASRWLAMAGGVLFFTSDGFVAGHAFHDADPLVASFWFGFVGWMLYWAGQAGLCLGGAGLKPAKT